jgi:threonine dehydratase
VAVTDPPAGRPGRQHSDLEATDRVAGELAVTAADVRKAAAAIAGRVVRTPTLASATLSAITGTQLWLKFENLQFTSSFKDRGALYHLLQLAPEARRRGVVAMSAGNHAQGVAYHATQLGIPATIVMPRFTPNVKVHNTQALGARVVLHGSDLAEAKALAHELERTEGLAFVPPYDDPHIIAGQGTVALEMLEDAPDLEVLVAPVGGGGLLAGMAVAARDLRPDIELVGVQSDLFPSMYDEVRHAHLPVGGTTIAEGIAVPNAGQLTAPIIAALVDDLMLVPEDEIEDAINLLLDIEKTVAEGAGATPLAAVLHDRPRFEGRKVGLVVSGGNIDPRVLASVIMHGLVRSGRLSRIAVAVTDVPGALAGLATVIGEQGGNIVEVAHQRMFSALSAKSTEIEIVVEARDREHSERIVQALADEGFKVTTRAS